MRTIQNLFQNKEFSDVTLVSEDLKQFKVNKFILSASSQFFEDKIRSAQKDINEIYLENVKYQEIESIIEFLYKGEVKVPENRLSQFIGAAQDLKITGLLDLDGDTNNACQENYDQANFDDVTFEASETRIPDYINNSGNKVLIMETTYQKMVAYDSQIKTEEDQNPTEPITRNSLYSQRLNPKCKECGKEFPKTKDWLNRLRRHLLEVHNSFLFNGAEKPKTFKCYPSCEKTFWRKEKFLKHQKSKNCPGNPDLKVICDNCQRLFKSNTQLNNHLHNRRCTQQYICDMCKQHFRKVAELSNHILSDVCS